MNYDNDLFYTCSLIEYIGRQCKQKRKDVVDFLGKEKIKRIYTHADVLHCEPIEAVADNYIEIASIPMGEYDNVAKCKYNVPDYWDIGEVYERLIEDVCKTDVLETLDEVYHSWISDSISNYNSDFYYQSREYIKCCYEANEILVS